MDQAIETVADEVDVGDAACWCSRCSSGSPWSPPCTAPGPGGDAAGAPEISAVIVITPTEYGTGADVRAIAALCHERGISLLVDEA